MPKPVQYKTGSLIYRTGEEIDKIFILQNGKVSLVSTDVETGNDTKDPIAPGEFFGVKSAFGRYPSEENAIVTSDSTIIVLTVPEFEKMALSNTRIIFKMLKVFSSQLRRVHTQISRLLESEAVKPDEGLYSIGEKFLKMRRFSHALYVFKRYLAIYPNGKKATLAKKNMELAEAGLLSGGRSPLLKNKKPKRPGA